MRTAAELATALRQEPFEVSDGDTYFITFLGTVPTAAQATALEALSNDFDTLVVRGRDVHWHMSGRSTDSRLASGTGSGSWVGTPARAATPRC